MCCWTTANSSGYVWGLGSADIIDHPEVADDAQKLVLVVLVDRSREGVEPILDPQRLRDDVAERVARELTRDVAEVAPAGHHPLKLDQPAVDPNDQLDEARARLALRLVGRRHRCTYHLGPLRGR